MNKLVLRNSIISAVLIIMLVFVLLWSDKPPYAKSQSYFASVPGDEITKIEIAGDNEKIILTNTDAGWMLNGTDETRRHEVLFLLRILKEMEIKSPVSPGLFQKEITEKNIQALKVKVFEGKRILNSFIVYQTSSNVYGNIMKKRIRTKPFIVYIPGYEGDIGSQFTFDEYFWKPFTIFKLLPSEISSVEVNNVREPHYSFTIKGKDGIFALDDSVRCIAGWDTTRVRRYISYFTWVPFENLAGELTPDSIRIIMTAKPLYQIGVKKASGETNILTLWERYEKGTGLPDNNRLWGKTNDMDKLFVVRYFDIDPLLKKVSYFCRD